MKRGSPSAGYHTRLLYPKIFRDMLRAAFQMRPYRDQNRQSGRRSNTINASVRYVTQAPDRLLAQEDLGFHPALAYKYSGEPGACKVGSCVMSSRVGCQHVALCGAWRHLGYRIARNSDSLRLIFLYYAPVRWKQQ